MDKGRLFRIVAPAMIKHEIKHLKSEDTSRI